MKLPVPMVDAPVVLKAAPELVGAIVPVAAVTAAVVVTDLVEVADVEVADVEVADVVEENVLAKVEEVLEVAARRVERPVVPGVPST